MDISPYQLGATLYVPATHPHIESVATGANIPELRSMVLCLEDSLSERDVQHGLTRLTELAENLSSHSRTDYPLVFIRPRNIEMAAHICQNINLHGITGLVLPKFNTSNMDAWLKAVGDNHLVLMPTLETQDVMCQQSMAALCERLMQPDTQRRILALRIGGNDLLNCIGIRRPQTGTLYDTPMAYVLGMLVATFARRGFALTAPVDERFQSLEDLTQEVVNDLKYGFVGKTAIHPTQIAVIQNALKVKPEDHESALKIINTSEAVFNHHGVMAEPATHRQWASNILEQAKYNGVVPTMVLNSQDA